MSQVLSPLINLCKKDSKYYVQMNFANFTDEYFNLEVSAAQLSADLTTKKYTITVQEVSAGEEEQFAELEGLAVGDTVEIEINDYPMMGFAKPENKGKVIIKFETVKL